MENSFVTISVMTRNGIDWTSLPLFKYWIFFVMPQNLISFANRGAMRIFYKIILLFIVFLQRLFWSGRKDFRPDISRCSFFALYDWVPLM